MAKAQTVEQPEQNEPRIDAARDELLSLNHAIRLVEQQLEKARFRRKLSNISVILGPILLTALYSTWVLLPIPNSVLWAAYLPAALLAVGFFVAAVILKTDPGGPLTADGRRASEDELELELAKLRENRKHLVASAAVPVKVRRMAYKEDAYADINQLRKESNGYRRINNSLQGVLIVGSFAAAGVSGIATDVRPLRWVVPGITFIVGVASGFMAYFKYKERSFYLQQTADAIEHEWEAVEVGIGRYKAENTAQEDKALHDFVEEVHRLKSEQKKRQQSLEQPADLSNGAVQ